MRITSSWTLEPGTECNEDEIISRILSNRQISDMNSFMNPVSPLTMSLKDFGYSSEIEHAISLLKELKDEKKQIIVYTDYDADGITGGAILWETLYLMGFNVMPYVPHRQTEGYGFSVKGLDAVKKQYDPALIISVDHGIAAVEQIRYAAEQGMKVIVTDHHNKQATIPDAAEAIFHIPQLSGSGVAYFFAKEVFTQIGQKQDKNYSLLHRYFMQDYLALASIGTIADLVPLVGPSRSIAKYGLQAFGNVNRVGLRQIMNEGSIGDRAITPFDIGFIIAPRINAIGRLEHALDALRLLCTTNAERAMELASKINNLNNDRKDLVKKAVEEARQQANDQIKDGIVPRVLILKSEQWHEGIIGLIASQIVDAFHRPAIIITQGEGHLKGSARSLPTVHITDFLTQLKHRLLNFGGHKQAAGFSMDPLEYETFCKEAQKIAEETISTEQLEHSIETDICIPLTYCTLSLAEKLSVFEPFGIGNPKPVFYSKGVVVQTKTMGKSNNHLKVSVRHTAADGYPLDLIAFGKGEDSVKLAKGQEVEAVFNLDINEWNGRRTIQGKLIHWQ